MGKGLSYELAAFLFLGFSITTLNQVLQCIILVLGVCSSVYGIYLMHKNDIKKRHTKK